MNDQFMAGYLHRSIATTSQAEFGMVHNIFSIPEVYSKRSIFYRYDNDLRVLQLPVGRFD